MNCIENALSIITIIACSICVALFVLASVTIIFLVPKSLSDIEEAIKKKEG